MSTRDADAYERLRQRLDEFPLKLPQGKGILEILRLIFTEEEADFISKFSSFQRYLTAEEFAKEHGYPLQKAKDMLFSLARRELIHYRKKGDKEEFTMRPFVVGMYEALFCNWRAQHKDVLVPVAKHADEYFNETFFKTISGSGFPWARVITSMIPIARLEQEHPELFGNAATPADEFKESFEKSRAMLDYAGREVTRLISKEGLGGVVKMARNDGGLIVESVSKTITSFLGTIFQQPAPKLDAPRAKSKEISIDHHVPVSLQVHPHEEIRHYIEQATSITVGDCACRKHHAILKDQVHDTMESTCGHSIADTCMQLFYDGYEANEYNSLGGRQVSKDEAIEITEKCEKEGLVHTSFNSKEKIQFICNCCPCCCGILGTVTRMNQKNGAFVSSNFLPFVDENACIRCGSCVAACPVQAIGHSKNELPSIDASKCIGCGLCAVKCSKQAMHMVKKKTHEPAADTVDVHLRFATQK